VNGWQPGDSVVLRRYNHRGRPTGALPARVVSRAGPVLWIAGGTASKWPGVGDRGVRQMSPEERFTTVWEPLDSTWWGDGVLIVGRPGRAHAIWLFRSEARFAGWYVNLEDPWRPWRLGFDTEDHTLDLWVDRDGAWRWKDEDELEIAVDVGFYTPEEAAAFRAEAEAVVAEWPFPTGWESWEPDEAWPLPTLPADWDELP
jgi:uncharacterized protein